MPCLALSVIGGVCLLFAITAWAFYGALFRRAPAQDFMVFYQAARVCLEGHRALLFDGAAFTQQLNHRFAALLSAPLDLHPWMYPPLFLLLVIPFGVLPFGAAYACFMLGSLAALACALRSIVPRGWPRWVCAAGLLLSPASAFTVAVGQNSFLTTALLVGGFGLIARAPLSAGVLLGLLACKPQLWLMVPVALLAARELRVLAYTLVTAASLALASLAAFGVETWRQWLTLMLAPNPLYRHWLQFGRLNGQSAYTDASLLGATPATANMIQLLVTLACAELVWWCFARSKLHADLKLAVLLTATVLAAPHVSNYDAVMAAVAVSLYLCWALRHGFVAGDAFLIIVASGIELLNPPQMVRLGLVTPLVLCALLAAVIARRPAARVHPTPAANTAPVHQG